MIEILSVKAWALETRFFNRMAPIVLRGLSEGRDLTSLITKQDQLDKPEVEAGQVYRVGTNLHYSSENGYHYLGDNETAISRTLLKGTVTKDGGACSYGTKKLGEKLRIADENKNVSAHIIEIDSPGGSVDGTPEFASIVAGLSKPVVAFVDSMAASAAYWIASQTSHIVTNPLNYTEVGSIGTLAIMTNEREYLKKEGIKVEIMRATKSVDKARLNTVEEWPEASLEEYQQYLDSINSDFIRAVNKGRNGKLATYGEDIFTGKMYDQKRALALGMIDRIGTLEDAIATARLLSRKAKTKTTT
ncbi:S49 family peptidase [Algoriphagus halophilus]|uniref:S49 family peptidase n=1 Tax=Algoriphagus halophilus TaxID=226505 RepID=UPI00358E884D